MLAKKYRLPVQNFVKKRGESKKTEYFHIKRFPTNNVYSRFGIVVGKKINKKAAERNKKKRIISSFFEENYKKIKNGDFIIISMPAINELDANSIKEELSKTFGR